MSTTSEQKITKGGAFLINETDPSSIFIPEDFNEEQRMIAATCDEFLEKYFKFVQF